MAAHPLFIIKVSYFYKLLLFQMVKLLLNQVFHLDVIQEYLDIMYNQLNLFHMDYLRHLHE